MLYCKCSPTYKNHPDLDPRLGTSSSLTLGPGTAKQVCWSEGHSCALEMRIRRRRKQQGSVQKKTTRKKNLIVANIHQENGEMQQHMQNGGKDYPVGGGKGHQPAGNRDRDRLADLHLTSDGPHAACKSMIGWVEMEMMWKCSWRR